MQIQRKQLSIALTVLALTGAMCAVFFTDSRHKAELEAAQKEVVDSQIRLTEERATLKREAAALKAVELKLNAEKRAIEADDQALEKLHRKIERMPVGSASNVQTGMAEYNAGVESMRNRLVKWKAEEGMRSRMLDAYDRHKKECSAQEVRLNERMQNLRAETLSDR